MILEADTPSVPGFSPEFNDLVAKLLEKDPLKRINWIELKRHPFWLA
jgi:serine/threonine protein kinase